MSAADILNDHRPGESFRARHRTLRKRATVTPCACGWTGENHGEHLVDELNRADLVIVEQNDLNRAIADLSTGGTIVGNHANMLALLKMDTPEDQERTDQLVVLARKSAQALDGMAARFANGSIL